MTDDWRVTPEMRVLRTPSARLAPPDPGSSKHESSERGAVLVLMLALLLIFMLLAGLAVDISARQNRAQEIQNATDAAALVGAQVYAKQSSDTSLGPGVAEQNARNTIENILRQNGIADPTAAQIGFSADTTVSVSVTEDVNGIFSSFTPGDGNVERNSKATHVACSRDCSQNVEAPPIFQPIEALGNGDGFLPIAVGDNLYSVNHHQNGIACVGKTTQQKCFPNKDAFPPATDTWKTMDVHHPTLIGSKIYYVGSSDQRWDNASAAEVDADQLRLTCFDTATDAICPESATLTGVGYGVMANVSDQLYLFTGDRKARCYNPSGGSFTDCGVFDTQASAFADADWLLHEVSTNVSDFKVVGSQVIYTLANDNVRWIQCFDTSTNSGCTNFGAFEAPGAGGAGRNQKVVLYRSDAASGATPESFCLIGTSQADCWSLSNGNRDTANSNAIELLRQVMTTADGVPSRNPDGQGFADNAWRVPWSGISSYHPSTNRVFTVDAYESRTFCFDFETDTPCAGTVPSNDENFLGVVHTYGYIEDSPDCLIGLGDTAIFFSMKPDLSGPCDSSSGDVTLNPCNCLGTPVWPRIAIVEAAGVSEFNIRVVDDMGVEVVPWTDLLLNDLVIGNAAPTSATLNLQFNIIVPPGATNPWWRRSPAISRRVRHAPA